MATGDNFILGQLSSATSPTQLQQDASASAFNVWNNGVRGEWSYARLAGGTGVEGHSLGAAGVQGFSTYSAGVAGESWRSDGIWGSSREGAGVVGFTENPDSFAGFFIGRVAVWDDLIVYGAKNAAVPHRDGSHRVLYSLECPESWFEDFGKGRLVRGRAKVRLARDFAAVVRTTNYYVFLTPEDDSRGLYVSSKDKTGFEVREQQGGKSSPRFSYRVVAKRRDIPGPRLPRVKLPERPKMPNMRPQTAPKEFLGRRTQDAR